MRAAPMKRGAKRATPIAAVARLSFPAGGGYIAKDVPQPQDEVALGLSRVK